MRVVRSFFTINQGRAERAGRPLAAAAGKRHAKDGTRSGRGASPADHRAGLYGERCAPGRRLPLLGPPGHGVGARIVPAARRTGPGAATISARRASCKRGHPPGVPV